MKNANTARLSTSSAARARRGTRTYTVSMRMCERLSSAAENPQALEIASA